MYNTHAAHTSVHTYTQTDMHAHMHIQRGALPSCGHDVSHLGVPGLFHCLLSHPVVFPASWPPSPKQHVALSGIRERLARCPGLSRTRNSIHLFPIEITQSCQVKLLEQKTALRIPQREMLTSEWRFGGSSMISSCETLHQTGGAKKSWECGRERGRESDALKKKERNF